MFNADTRFFPCPVCLKPLDVRTTKRKKPYVICSPCGVQMFIRERAGIAAFEGLVEQGRKDNVMARIANLEQRYRLKCPECGKSFWAIPELLETKLLGGKVEGYRCPEKNCRGIVAPKERAQQGTSASPETHATERKRSI